MENKVIVKPHSVVLNKLPRSSIVVKYERATRSNPDLLGYFSVNTPLSGIVEMIVKSHGP